MIQNITSLFTSSPVVPISATQPIKNITRVQSESASESGAVKLTISPEAQRALAKYQSGNDQTSDKVKSEKEFQSIDANDPASKSKKMTDPATQLSPEEERIIQRLKQIDAEVRTHERQHVAAAGGYVNSGPVYNYSTGPDGKRYAVGGRVSLDVTPVPNNPEATIRKAQIIKRAALAPADPSGADRAVAATASRMEMKAREQLRMEEENNLNSYGFEKQDPKINAYNQSTDQLGQTINYLF